MQAKLHENPNYGIASTYFAPIVDDILQRFNIKDLLDYGAGKLRLRDSITIDVNYTAYEPSNPEYDSEPEPTEFVTCIDVLEHIEPELLDNVLDDLQQVTLKYGLFTIHTGPAVKTLPDGRNAHLIQQPYTWWQPKIKERFDIVKEIAMDNGYLVFVKHK
jgi:hypothetical protein